LKPIDAILHYKNNQSKMQVFRPCGVQDLSIAIQSFLNICDRIKIWYLDPRTYLWIDLGNQTLQEMETVINIKVKIEPSLWILSSNPEWENYNGCLRMCIYDEFILDYDLYKRFTQLFQHLNPTNEKFKKIFAISNPTLHDAFQSYLKNLSLRFDIPKLFRLEDWKRIGRTLGHSENEADKTRKLAFFNHFQSYVRKFEWNEKAKVFFSFFILFYFILFFFFFFFL